MSEKSELLNEFFELIKNSLEDCKNDQPEIAAQIITDRIKFHFGGVLLYIPKDCKREEITRNRLICEQFTGSNQTELARKYGLSLQRIYKILKINQT